MGGSDSERERQNQLVWRLGNEKEALPRRSCKRLLRNVRICQETDRARHARIDEVSMHQERIPNPTTVSQLMTQIRELQHKVKFPCQTQENFTILNHGAALEPPTFPIEPLLF